MNSSLNTLTPYVPLSHTEGEGDGNKFGGYPQAPSPDWIGALPLTGGFQTSSIVRSFSIVAEHLRVYPMKMANSGGFPWGQAPLVGGTGGAPQIQFPLPGKEGG